MQKGFHVTKAKKLLCLLLCIFFVFGLVACNKAEEEESTSVAEELPSLEPDSRPEEEEVGEADPLEVAFLTGLEKDASYPEGKRIAAVMVNNIAGSRPTRGLSEAKILFEIKVEGGITRFMALFEDYENMPEVGSIRSARDQFLQLIIPFQAFYIHDGPGDATHPVNQMLKNYEYSEYDMQPNLGFAWRDQARAARLPSEYTEYTSGERVAQAVAQHGLDDNRQYNSPIFSFEPYNQAPRTLSMGTATDVGIIHSASYRTSFTYRDGRYYMSQYSSSTGSIDATIDENNGEQVAFDNVLVLFAPMQLYNASELVKVGYSAGGGYYISNGTWENLLWEKSAPDRPLTLKNIDKSGDTVSLNPGTTYIAIVDDSLIGDFDEALRANSSADIAEGEMNANETETDD